MSHGRATFLLGLALVAGAALFDSPVLYVPGGGLALLSAVTRIWVARAASGVSLRCRPDSWSIIEGDSWPLLVELRTGRVPLPGAAFEHPQLASAPRVGREGRGRERLTQVTLGFPRRGRWELGALTLAVADPLGLHRRGTPAARIHWPTVARTGELVEHRLLSGGEAPPLVTLDTAGGSREDT